MKRAKTEREVQELALELTAKQMAWLAEMIEGTLNGSDPLPEEREAFVLLVFPAKGADAQHVNYIANARREGVIAALRAILARFESGEPDAREPRH
jgi:hypothetical protein